jgi:hypothetical protein
MLVIEPSALCMLGKYFTTNLHLQPICSFRLGVDSFLITYLLIWDKLSLCSPGWPQTHDSVASPFWVLGLQAWAITPGLLAFF